MLVYLYYGIIHSQENYTKWRFSVLEIAHNIVLDHRVCYTFQIHDPKYEKNGIKIMKKYIYRQRKCIIPQRNQSHNVRKDKRCFGEPFFK